MKAYVNNKLILTAIFVSFCFICKSQITTDKQVGKNSISLKFANYSEEIDCKVVEMLKEMKDVKLVFSCITVGLLIIESENLVAETFKEKLDNKIMLKHENISFDVIEEYTSSNSVKNSFN